MSKQTEALKLALEALKQIDEAMPFPVAKLAQQVIREALAEQPAQQQEPVCDKDPQGCWSVRCQLGKVCKNTSPPASKPLTDEQFLELILRNGTVELVGACTFVGGSIQMQGKMGLLRSAKIIKEFVEAAHGITGESK